MGFLGEQVRLFVRMPGRGVVCIPGGCVETAAGIWITSTERQDRLRSASPEWWFVRCMDAHHGRRCIESFDYLTQVGPPPHTAPALPFESSGATIAAHGRAAA